MRCERQAETPPAAPPAGLARWLSPPLVSRPKNFDFQNFPPAKNLGRFAPEAGALYGPAGEEVAVSLEPKRALTLAQELLTCAIQAITADPEALLAPE